MDGSTEVDAYLDTLPADRRAGLERLRRLVRAAAPDAVETIAYKMPAYRSHGGRFLVSFDAYARHDSLFPASDAVVERLGEAIRPYVSGKGTIRWSREAPIPDELVTEIVRIRLEENASASA